MPLHPFAPPKGRFERLMIESEHLAGNLLGDPTERIVDVYLPEHDEGTALPLFVALAPFTGSGQKLHGWQSYGETLPQRLDRLIEAGEMGPVALAMPDGFTSLGGNQYIDSATMGNWEQYLLHEAIPAIESCLPVDPDPKKRAVFGKSSGGYGAMIHGMRHAEHWGGIACQSGDMGFELTILPEFAKALIALQPYDGDPAAFLDAVRESPTISGGQMWTQMTLALAATYDPDPDARYGVQLPVDPETCRTIDERWQQWLRHDPLVLIDEASSQQNLQSLRGIWIDCGAQDPYLLQFPARRLSQRLKALKIEHVFEEFEGTHSGIDHRYDRTMPFLYKVLVAG